MNFRNTLGAVAGFALLASAPLAVAQDDAQTTRYYWDLTDIFPSEQAWEEARLAVEARVEALESLRGTLGNSPRAMLRGFLSTPA